MPDRPQVTITVYSAAGRVWSWITAGTLGSRDEATTECIPRPPHVARRSITYWRVHLEG